LERNRSDLMGPVCEDAGITKISVFWRVRSPRLFNCRKCFGQHADFFAV
jgi:hypothetical protein